MDEFCQNLDPEVKDAMSDHGERERPTFIYSVEGEPAVGTLVDYANARAQAHYADLAVSSDILVVKHDGVGWIISTHEVVAESTPYDENDYAYLTLKVLGDEVTVQIDGRA